MEIERKFTIRHLPEQLDSYSFHVIEQAYLNTDPVIRVRREDRTYYMTYKGKGLISHEEYNLPLNRKSYEHLLAKADGNIITKKRYLIPIPSSELSMECRQLLKDEKDGSETGLTVELDIFDPPFAPLIIAEVEFPTEETAEAFQPLDWFLQDVTQDSAYHNANMSQRVFP